KLLTICLLITVTMISCNESDEPERLAQESCDCMKSHFLTGLSGDFNREALPECAKEITQTIRKKLKDATPDERARFTRAFLHAALDTDCATMAFTMIPFDELLDQYTQKNLTVPTDTLN